MYFLPYTPYFVFDPSYCFIPPSSFCQMKMPFEGQSNRKTEETTIIASSVLKPSLSESFLTEVEQMKPKVVKKDLKQKLQLVDEDYRPDGSNNRKKLKMKQIQNRNIIPNVVRLIISFIQKKGKSQKIVEKLLEKSCFNKEWTPKRFYHYQGMLKNHLNNYVNEETLRLLVKIHPQMFDVYGEAEQRFYNRITRTLINEFIRDDFVIYVLTSKRMDKTKKSHHLSALRSIRSNLKNLLSSSGCL